MSAQDPLNDWSLVPARSDSSDLARFAATTSLISRGISDLAQRSLNAGEQVTLKLKDALHYYDRAMQWLDDCEEANAIRDLDEAIRLCDEAIRVDPHNALAYRQRGKAWLGKNRAGSDDDHSNNEDCDKAFKEFDEAIRLDPKNATTYGERGGAWFWGVGDRSKALKDFDEAIRLDPSNPDWYLRRGDILYDVKDYDKAIIDFDEARRLDRRQRTLAVPPKLEINLPGELSVSATSRWGVVLAETPASIEINATALADVHERIVAEKRHRFEKLVALKAPEVILQNEVRILRRCEAAAQKTYLPEDYSYQFKAKKEHFDSAEFKKAVVTLSGLTQLEVLDLSESSVTDKALADVQRLGNLRALDLTDCVQISDEGVEHLASLSQLEELRLSGCSLTDRSVAYLCGIKKLRMLCLYGCANLTEAGVGRLKAALPQCDIAS